MRCSTSAMLRRVRTRGESSPGMGGRAGNAPGDSGYVLTLVSGEPAPADKTVEPEASGPAGPADASGLVVGSALGLVAGGALIVAGRRLRDTA